jgi:hypothetical protein
MNEAAKGTQELTGAPQRVTWSRLLKFLKSDMKKRGDELVRSSGRHNKEDCSVVMGSDKSTDEVRDGEMSEENWASD